MICSLCALPIIIKESEGLQGEHTIPSGHYLVQNLKIVGLFSFHSRLLSDRDDTNWKACIYYFLNIKMSTSTNKKTKQIECAMGVMLD